VHGQRHGREKTVATIERIDSILAALARTIAPGSVGPQAYQQRGLHLCEFLSEIFRGRELLQCSKIRTGQEYRFSSAFRIVVLAAPDQIQRGERDTTTTATAAASKSIIFEKAQAFRNAREERLVFLTKNIKHHPKAETSACGNALQSARIRLRSDAIDRVLALHFGQFIVQVLAHLRTDAVDQ
jgi:hypothetical protein